ncbi:hypothetical protein NL676_000074 [Syzygium grande]|nr:hypothetical protein NL676_000074 [Syzygium grande]
MFNRTLPLPPPSHAALSQARSQPSLKSTARGRPFPDLRRGFQPMSSKKIEEADGAQPQGRGACEAQGLGKARVNVAAR